MFSSKKPCTNLKTSSIQHFIFWCFKVSTDATTIVSNSSCFIVPRVSSFSVLLSQRH